jgi:hypothetical protein
MKSDSSVTIEIRRPSEARINQRLLHPNENLSTDAKPMAVKIPTTTHSRVHGFIDDLINRILDTCECQPHAVPLTMFITSRPHTRDSWGGIKWRAILSLLKLLAEGSPAK